MRSGWKTMMVAAGLLLAGAGQATAPVTVATPALSVDPATTPAATSPAVTTPAATAPANPVIAQDGAPAMAARTDIGVPVARAYGIQPQVTANGRRAHWFHDAILVPTIILISIFVLILLAVTMWKFRRREHREPSKTTHNTLIEVIWTLAPVIILVGLAVPSIGLLSAQFKPAPAGAITLKAIGNQWYWSYQYPDNGGFEITANMLKDQNDPTRDPAARFRTAADGPRLLATDNRVVLPVGVPIRLITTSNDVIHSWSLPAFWIKLDAVPGRLNETSFTIEKPGVYFGQCSELCGARHGYMPITVEAVSPVQFAAWVRAKGGKVGGAPAGDNGQAAPPAAPAGNPGDVETRPAETAPTVSATTAPATSSQPATGNPAGAGNAGQ